ncbi:MAG: choice-of-anchor D domain-containing protein, partial [Acidobacteriota bacterium]|nr:choice-of-anchor D domain-containing protein [Acidobacteriota bacterium]
MKTRAQKSETQYHTPIFRHVSSCPEHGPVLALLALAATIGLTIALSSCAGYTTNAAATASQMATGVLSASASTVDFGNVPVGSSATQSFTLTDTGTAPVSISSVSVSGAGFSLSGGNSTGTLAAGQSATVQLVFAPPSAGSLSADVTIVSDASSVSGAAAGTSSTITAQATTTTSFKVHLHGNATQAVLSISPTSVAFSNVVVGQSGTQIVTLTNTGTSNLQLKSDSLTGTGFAIAGLTVPQTIAPGQGISFTVQYSPAAAGSTSGNIAFSDNAPGSPQTLPITASAVAPSGTLSANPASYNFNGVVVGSSSQQTITLTNSGAGAVTINSVSTSGAGFAASGISAGQSIAAGAQASCTATFAPTAAGSASGSITISTTASNPTLSIALGGTGTQGALSANPSSINFGSILIGSQASTSVTLTNSGTAPVSVSAASVSGSGFTLSGFTAAALNPGATGSFSVTFAPTASGSATGMVSVTSNAPGSPLTMALSGSGTATQPQLSISPSSVSFSNVNVGSSASQTVTLTNTGNAALTIAAATISGSGYTMTLAPATINAGAHTTFSVTFTPAAEGNAPGSISITSNAPGSPAAIVLSGTGLESLGSASPTSVSFGSVAVGSSNSSVITLQNTGNATLSFSQVSVSGTGFSISGLTTASTIAAGASLNFNAVFTPAAATSSTGSITLATNGSPSQISIALSGTGAAATQTLGASPTSLSFGNVQVGRSASLTTTVTSTGNSSVSISTVNVTGAGYTASGITPGLVLSPNQSVTLTVNFAPT